MYNFLSIIPVIHFDGLVQDCSNFSELAVELLQSCTKQSIYPYSSWLLLSGHEENWIIWVKLTGSNYNKTQSMCTVQM